LPRLCRGSIDDHQFPKDGRVRWERGRPLENVLEGQIVCPLEIDPPFELLELFAHFRQPELFKRGSTIDDRDDFRVRQQAKNILDEGWQVMFDRDDSVIGGKGRMLNPAFFDRGEYHGRAGE
jgi:hypothetical protein